MALAGLSTLGILFGYGVETTPGTKPTAFTVLTRINSIGGITIDREQIDASALEDLVTKYVAGRQDTGGTFPVTINLTEETTKEWQTLIDAYKTAQETGKSVWFGTYSPYMKDAFYVVAEPPLVIPQPETDQNGLWTVEMTLTIHEYRGLETAIKPAESGAGA